MPGTASVTTYACFMASSGRSTPASTDSAVMPVSPHKYGSDIFGALARVELPRA